MPPQQDHFPSETGRDVAGLGHDVSTAAAEDVTADVLSQKDAAGPQTASTRSVVRLLQQYWRRFQERRERHRLRAVLQGLSDRELTDIGVTSSEIERIAAHRTIDRLRNDATRLWMHSGG